MGTQAEHILNLLRRVLLSSTEHVRLAALLISDLVHLSLEIMSTRYQCNRDDGRTIVPKVTRPTRAYGGSKLKLTTIASRRAFMSSGSMQVSMTKTNMGGTGAGRESVYSMVVYFGRSSAGRLVLEMSL